MSALERATRGPRNKAEFERLVEPLDEVLDAGGADERNPLASLADHLGSLIADYETAHRPKRDMPVTKFLRELIKQHDLKQADLPEIGTQSVVSEVLSGKRKLNLRQVFRAGKALPAPGGRLHSVTTVCRNCAERNERPPLVATIQRCGD